MRELIVTTEKLRDEMRAAFEESARLKAEANRLVAEARALAGRRRRLPIVK